MKASEAAVYVHVPFCRAACPYCNFNFRLRSQYSDEFVDGYVAAVLREWHAVRTRWNLGERIFSLYLGGGTPSLLSPQQVAHLIETIGGAAREEIEITLEANPEDVAGNIERLAGFRSAGVNRLSLGVQSFTPRLLKGLGRNHSADEARLAVRGAHAAGFKNISCDLMGALPQQSMEELQSDLRALLELPIQHVSHYSLAVEEKTLFHAKARRGNLDVPEEDLAVAMLHEIEEQLRVAGFAHYEISNYARPDFESRHNLAYWTFREFAGLGAGAHSFFRRAGVSHRSMNLRDPRAYVKRIGEQGLATESWEELTGRKAMSEFVFTGLRRMEGFLLESFREHFEETFFSVYEKEVSFLTREGLLRLQPGPCGDQLQLTRRGIYLSDSVFEQFI